MLNGGEVSRPNESAHPWVMTALEAFQAERGISRNTFLAYCRDIKDCASYLISVGKSFEDAETRDFVNYLAFLHDKGLSATTCNRRLSAIRQLYKFVFSEALRSDNPTLDIPPMQRGRKLPHVLSIEEVAALLDAAQAKSHTFAGLRLLCMMELVYATGMRVSEMLSLPVAPLNNDPEVIYIQGKGNKERAIPLTNEARCVLSQWIDMRNEKEKIDILGQKDSRCSVYLFPSRGKKGHITRERFFQMIREVAKISGVDKAVSPHALRHAFATHLLQKGASLFLIQNLLGHADISTTQIYTHVANERLKSVVFDKHPLANGL
jgi:integrase/recombinase XerD